MAMTTTRLSPLDHGRAMSLAEFREAEVEEGYRYELGRGVVEVTRIPGTRHNQVVCNLYRTTSRYEVANPRRILRFGGGSESRLWIPDLVSGRNPDFAVVLRPEPGLRDKDPQPALVAEVVSARSVERDYVVKRAEYLACGLAEYWIVDFQLRRLTLLVRVEDAWTEQVLSGAEVIPSVVLPGLLTRVDDLWRDLDYYDQEDEDEHLGVDG